MTAARTELLKAAIILGLGVAMVVAPGVADEGAEDYSTIPRTLAWAWSRPLGLLFTAVGLIGLYALTVASRREPAAGGA